MTTAEALTSVDLTTPYVSTALYLSEADLVEYVSDDVPAVYRRVDPMLTLIFRMDDRDHLIGFTLKGFRSFYLDGRAQPGLGEDFLPLVSLIERAATTAGDEVCDAEERRRSYRLAGELAVADKVVLRDLPRVA